MACEVKIRWVVMILCLVSNLQHWVHGEPQVPCFFILGDSLVDNGNNNALLTLAKSNFPPYGIDFHDGPTGRFCNGRTLVDVIAELLGFDNYIPPFATASKQDILKGVNYASGGAGIRNESGWHLGARITLDVQLRNHQTIVSRIANILGNNESAANYLSKCLYYVIIGGNDYINNYYLPVLYPSSRQYTPHQYAQALIEQYTQQLMRLYKFGARKVVLMGLGAIGCTPNMIVLYGKNGSTSCAEDINNSVQLFNNKLISLVDDLNTNLTDAKFIYVDYYNISSSVVSSPDFKVKNSGCCGGGKDKGVIPCLPLQIPCKNRSKYVFWDLYHPTEAANVMAAGRSYNAQTPSDAYPFDIRRLVQL